MKTRKSITLALLSLSATIVACEGHKHAAEGGILGSAGGGALGAIIGNGSDHTAEGAILGAVIGGAAGALIGDHMDKQAAELRQDLAGASVTRVGEGIKVTLGNELLFAVDRSAVSDAARRDLAQMATTLNKYDDTDVLIEGHTDADGSEEHNMRLSKDRAESVASVLIANGVKASRISTVGYGESQPTADNSTAEGKARNRRVEIAIYANKRMRKAAERGEIGMN